MADLNKLMEEIKAMTVLELNDFVKALEEEFGVSAAAPVAAVGAFAAAPAEEENTEFEQQTDSSREVILEMHKSGLSILEIAKHLGLGVGEVKLVVDLYQGEAK